MENFNVSMLNDVQQQAVCGELGNYLILAGAGSGKTRVLVQRMVYLMQHYGVSPHSILSVTFTNKAAREMQSRVAASANASSSGMWIGTFHGLAYRMLRMYWREAGLSENFQIIDQDDQLRLIKRVMQSFSLDEKQWPSKQAQWFIGQQKEKGLRANAVPNQSDFHTATLTKVYLEYENICKQSSLLDFGELLLLTLEVMQRNVNVLSYFQNKFKHILIDEFQDTNTIQYQWLRMIAGANAYVIAVGDDDQSIYSWRGANVENINSFSADFSNVHIVRLEQNYRSTKVILDAANAVIAKNNNRMGKNLWTEGNSGSKIKVYEASDEYDEAYNIVDNIRRIHTNGVSYNDIAILYRSNAQSRVLEEKLIQAQLPYRIYGGQKFFERAEIKDAIAYCRLLANSKDDAAFDRIINVPPRGIGEQTILKLRHIAQNNSTSMWDATEHAIQTSALSPRAVSSLAQFVDLINDCKSQATHLPLDELCAYCVNHSGLLSHYKKDRTENGISRVENLNELISAMEKFFASYQVDELHVPPLEAYLSHVALELGEGSSSDVQDSVNLMTLHAAKGLEFKVVFMCGLEEGLFPHKMSLDSLNGLEEERRLCYVGMTRAKEFLFISYALWRRMYYQEKRIASRFLREIPDECLDRSGRNGNRYGEDISYTAHAVVDEEGLTREAICEDGLAIGQHVRHPKFGAGRIVQCEGSGDSARLAVDFKSVGLKWLVAKFARLEEI
jgi:DNA helicase-2/ATP-dependent DNA helicase PcrA